MEMANAASSASESSSSGGSNSSDSESAGVQSDSDEPTSGNWVCSLGSFNHSIQSVQQFNLLVQLVSSFLG